MPTTIDPQLFQQAAAGYVHRQKLALPCPPAQADRVFLKWYAVHAPERPFADDEIVEAQQFMLDEIASGRLALEGEVGFVVQHRVAATDIFYVCSWRDNNELWETHYYRAHGDDSSFDLAHHETKFPTFCVWVLSIVTHESEAWSRYLNSARDADARSRYCADQLSGPVG